MDWRTVRKLGSWGSLIAATGACAKTPPAHAPPQPRPSDAPEQCVPNVPRVAPGIVPGRAVTLPSSQAQRVNLLCQESAPRIEGGWDPAPEDIARLEANLADLHLRIRSGCVGDVNSYYRQYVGVLIGGQKVIFVNAFVPSGLGDADDWKRQLEDVCDGGESVWGAVFHPAFSEFRDFAFSLGPPES